MEIKKPENFLDMLELQKFQDKHIKNNIPRKLEHIKLSLIAECTEFNEETKDTHKTWKPFKYDKEKELEELVDVWFFTAQLINYAEMIDQITILERKGLDNFFIDIDVNFDFRVNILTVIFNLKPSVLCYDWLKFFIQDLMIITNNYRYTTKDILDGYWKKLNYNLNERIGKEWN